MKKSLFLLPLLASLALVGCGKDKGGNNGGDGGNGGNNSGDNGGGSVDFDGLTIDVDKLGEVENKDEGGYKRLAGVEEIDGYSVSFTDVMTNGLNSESIPKWDTPDDEKVQIIQFKKSSGVFAITGCITKLTLKVYSSYDWSGTGLPTVTFDGSTIAKPSKASNTEATGCKSYNSAGTKSFDLNLLSVEYAVNATSEGELKISNSNSFALYFDSFILE